MNLLKYLLVADNWAKGTEGKVSVQDVGRDVHC